MKGEEGRRWGDKGGGGRWREREEGEEVGEKGRRGEGGHFSLHCYKLFFFFFQVDILSVCLRRSCQSVRRCIGLEINKLI